MLAQQQHEAVAIIVSDNGSTDDTRKVAERFKKLIPNLHYHRNEENIGFDGNIIKLYELARTTYIWFLSDDDPIEAGAVQTVVDTLNQYKPTVALFRSSFVDELTGVKQMNNPWKIKQKVFENVHSDDFNTALLSAIFISVLVVRKEPSLTSEYLASFSGYGDIHMTLSLLLLSKRFRFHLFDSAIVCRTQGHVYPNDIVDRFITDIFHSVNLPEIGLNMNTLKGLIFSNGYRSIAKVILSSKIGRDIIETPIKLRRILDLYWLFGKSSLWGIGYLVVCLFMPPPIVKLMYLGRLTRRFGFKQGLKLFRRGHAQP